MALWGSLFPMIKIGYSTLGIAHDSISSILLFAGIRFTLCGSVALGISFAKKDKIEGNRKNIVSQILLIALFSIVLHYAFTYIGLSIADSSKTALIKQIGSLAYVCCAPIFFKSERFSALKLIGAIVGFCGIIAINYTDGAIVFTRADLLILAASACTVVSSIANKNVAPKVSGFLITGISQLSGGIVLLLAALIMGGASISPTPLGIATFCYICAASTVAYLLWSYVLRTGSLSKMFIIKFAEPLFACMFGAILLGEDILKIQYLLAFVLISAGIMLANKEK
jgi:drug/metabolite transporter (DMT)-like permease